MDYGLVPCTGAKLLVGHCVVYGDNEGVAVPAYAVVPRQQLEDGFFNAEDESIKDTVLW